MEYDVHSIVLGIFSLIWQLSFTDKVCNIWNEFSLMSSELVFFIADVIVSMKYYTWRMK